MQTSKKTFLKLNMTGKRVLVLIVLSILFSLSFSVGINLELYDSVVPGKVFFLALVLLAAFGFAAFSFVYYLFDLLSEKNEGGSKPKPVLIFLISIIALLLIYGVYFLAFYPGFFVFDAPTQYTSYLNNNMSEHHPLLHTLILGFILNTVSENPDSINHGTAVYSLIQMLLSILSFSCLISYVYEKLRNMTVYILSLLFVSFYPPVVMTVFSVTKDSVFLIFFILSFVFLLDLGTKEKTGKRVIFSIIGLTTSIVLMTVFRNNCIYAVPFLIISALIVYKKRRKELLIVFSCFLAVFLLYKLLFVPQFVSHKTDDREKLSVPIQQVMCIYTDGNAAISDEDKCIVENLVSEEGRVYIPSIADIPKSCFNVSYFEENKTAVVKMYLRLIKNNPKDALYAFLKLNEGYYYPFTELTLMPWGEKGYWPIGCFRPAVSNPKIPYIFEFYEKLADSEFLKSGPLTMWLFAPASFFWIFLLLFGYVLQDGKKIFVPGFLFILCFYASFLLGPVVLVRYTIYLYLMIPAYFLCLKKNNSEDSASLEF